MNKGTIIAATSLFYNLETRLKSLNKSEEKKNIFKVV
jgi:DNA mismatch repair ATPase MutL